MSECVHHTDYDSPRGYGRRMVGKKVVGSHRVVYCEANNVTLESIKGLEVRHTCDNPRCVNPEHLLIGTHQDNQDDKVKRGRQVQGVDVHTSVLTPQQVRHIREVYKPRDRLYGACALARLYGVHNTTINRLVNNKTWSSI
ncbi:hypothetical protein [Vibrio phage vB_VhaP_VH-5]|uniref:HNH nuclease domain-containing protein n=1 Tax=Vibrio phage vB_VhaP_VH-5 TaxID=2660694 RepID=A0A5Q2WBF7_9CAUD|nr:hypothetical protein [Vibrio phage vB_VhaP_VH-5]